MRRHGEMILPNGTRDEVYRVIIVLLNKLNFHTENGRHNMHTNFQVEKESRVRMTS